MERELIFDYFINLAEDRRLKNLGKSIHFENFMHFAFYHSTYLIFSQYKCEKSLQFIYHRIITKNSVRFVYCELHTSDC